MAASRDWVTVPNLLSILRLALTPVFLVLIISGQGLWALAVLAVAGASDWLDGKIARRFNQVTRLGQLLDPAADRLYIFAALIGLTVTNHIPIWFAVAVISRDLILLPSYLILASRGWAPPQVTFIGKAATFALLYALPLHLLAELIPIAAFVISPLAWAFGIWGLALYWFAGWIYFKQVANLFTRRISP